MRVKLWIGAAGGVVLAVLTLSIPISAQQTEKPTILLVRMPPLSVMTVLRADGEL